MNHLHSILKLRVSQTEFVNLGFWSIFSIAY